MLFQPLNGWRQVKVTATRKKADFAHCLRNLVDIHFPHAPIIRVVLDNLNTHTLGALYETFEPAEARRIARRLEFHFTPKHGSWLNMVEIELSILSRQCLQRRLPDPAVLQAETSAWANTRNAQPLIGVFQFTTPVPS
jgi:transposase